MDFFVSVIGVQLRKELPFVDETGIQGNIDIDMDFDLRKPRLEHYRQALASYGLRIMEVEREIEVLVIRDAVKWH